jgi:hypothetical protein
MWKTKSARFNAHARLVAKHWLSTTATALLALYLVAVSLVPLAFEKNMTAETIRALAVISLITSVFLIIITLLESARNYHREADRMHKCALEIAELYNRLQAMPLEEAETKRTNLNDEYSRILRLHEINHKTIDFLQFQLSFHRDLRFGGRDLLFGYLRYGVLWIAEYWIYIVIIFVPPAAVFVFHKQIGF